MKVIAGCHAVVFSPEHTREFSLASPVDGGRGRPGRSGRDIRSSLSRTGLVWTTQAEFRDIPGRHIQSLLYLRKFDSAEETARKICDSCPRVSSWGRIIAEKNWQEESSGAPRGLIHYSHWIMNAKLSLHCTGGASDLVSFT